MSEYQQMAHDMLSEDGFEVLVLNYTLSDFDPDTGNRKTNKEEIEGFALFTTLKQGDFKENIYSFKEINSVILLSIPIDKEINIDSKISINGKRYKILVFTEIKDKTTTAVYKVVLKNEK